MKIALHIPSLTRNVTPMAITANYPQPSVEIKNQEAADQPTVRDLNLPDDIIRGWPSSTTDAAN